ncbi:hypothetical protein HPP92_009632, partial [Vanilla planifolia]
SNISYAGLKCEAGIKIAQWKPRDCLLVSRVSTGKKLPGRVDYFQEGTWESP